MSLGMKCQDCLHHSTGPKRFERLCSALGVEPFAPACPEFSPNIQTLANSDTKALVKLAGITQTFTKEQLRILAFTFRNLDYIRKAGFEFGQTVVFSINGRQYLENYFRGIVIGATRNGQLCHIASCLENLNPRNCLLSLFSNDVLSLDKFQALRQSLIQRERLREPKGDRTLSMLKMSPEQLSIYKASLEKEPNEYSPPTLDTVPQEWLDSRQAGTLKRRKKPEQYLVKPPQSPIPEEKEFKISRY